ncbi:Lipid A export ATP-binding/permease protein MsbA [Fimbriiglobus ruber]|uniref:Lipid A export ATP-binding/permease protein MsbA n=1 Tax=Fimbriiglobus ruber TaxID=1908690 RepID=A0A225EGM0_9BACT|nr:Lipid A export ATP-binding/permease protein MsbA [Fimbriiglobus ruber]
MDRRAPRLAGGWNTWAWAGAEYGAANNSYLTGLFAIAFVLALVRGLFLNTAAHGAAVATVDAATRLRRAIHMHGYRLAAVAVRPEARDEAGELITRRVEQVRDGLQAYLTAGIRGPVLTVLLLAILLLTHLWLTVCLLALAAAVWLVAGQAAVWFRRDARRAERRTEARLGMMRESLSQVQLVKAYLMDRFSQTRLERHLTDLSKSEWRRQRGDAISRPTLYAIVGLVGVTMLYLSGRVVMGGEMSVAGLIVKAAALGALVYGVNRWIAARVRITRAREAAADVIEFLGRRGEAGQGIDAEFLPPMTRKLEFVGVSLREAGTGRMILEDVNLVLPALTRGAVVFGDADEARSLALLITRFLEPTAGEVRIDGKNTRWVTSESVRTQVALVLEQSLTFTDTVANNIGCGEPGFSLPRIVEAAKLAHVHQFVQRMPYGYETVIGDGGVSLRPGSGSGSRWPAPCSATRPSSSSRNRPSRSTWTASSSSKTRSREFGRPGLYYSWPGGRRRSRPRTACTCCRRARSSPPAATTSCWPGANRTGR